MSSRKRERPPPLAMAADEIAFPQNVDSESVNNTETDVVLSQVDLGVAKKIRIGGRMLEILRTEIRILILKAQSPMIVERVLQAAANHPPESGIAVAPALMKRRAVLNNSLFKVD